MSEMIQVVILEPRKPARPAAIENSLHEMQRIVGGNIEPLYLPDDTACIVCNDSGKIDGLPLNRAIRSDGPEHEIVEIIAGRCFICGCGEEDFVGLSKPQMQRYLAKFKYPEMFFSRNGTIEAVPIRPKDRGQER